MHYDAMNLTDFDNMTEAEKRRAYDHYRAVRNSLEDQLSAVRFRQSYIWQQLSSIQNARRGTATITRGQS
jgi:hypothetical protein